MYSDNTIKRDGSRPFPMRLLINVRKYATKKKRQELNLRIAQTLGDVDFTLFTNNCLGGVFYHDAGRQFTSPTINLSFDAEEYISFLENPLKYQDAEFEFYSVEGYDFPVAKINGMEVHFVHYKTPEECIAKWNERFKRIVWDNIYVIATDHDGMYEDRWKERFDKLPYKNKIMFVADKNARYNWEIPVKQFWGRNNVRVMTSFANFKGQRYYETVFDIAHWIAENSKSIHDNNTEGE